MEEKLLIKIQTDLSGLKKGMSTAAGEMDKLKTKTSKISTSFKKLGGVIAGAFAVKAVVGFGKKIVETSAELDAMKSQFSQVFKGKYNTEALDDINEKVERLNIHPDRLMSSYNKVGSQMNAAFGPGKEAITATGKAIEMVADASAWMDTTLEEATGSMSSYLKGNYEASDALGFTSSATQLAQFAAEEYGLEFKNLTEEQKTNMRLDYAEHMMNESGAVGQAARESESYANVMGNLKAAWDNFLAVIGSPILAVVVDVVQVLSDKITALSDWVKGFDWGKITNSEPILLVKDIIGYIQDAVGFLWEKVTAFNWGSITNSELFLNIQSIIGDVRDRIQWIVDKVTTFDWAALANSEPITLVKDAIGFVYDKINEVLLAVQEFDWGVITDSQLFEVIKDVFQWLVDNIPVAVGHIADFFTKIIESEQAQAIFTAIKDAGAILADKLLNIKDTAAQFSDWVKENQDILLGLATFFGSIAAMVGLYNIGIAIANGLTGAWAAISGLAATATALFAAAMAFLTSPIVIAMLAIAAIITIGVLLWKNWDKIKAKAGELATAFKEKFQAIKDKVSEVFNNIKTAMSEKFEAAKKAVTDKITAIKTFFSEKFQAIKDKVAEIFDNIKTAISDKIEAAKTTVGTVLDGIKTFFSDKMNAAKDTVLNIFDNIKQGISDKIEAAKKFVGDMIDKIKDFFNFKWELPKLKLPTISITGKFSLAPPQIPKFGINWNARGGIFKKPTLLGNGQGVGDASNGHGSSPEVVAPLSELKQMLGLDGKGGNVTINLNGNYSFRDKADMDYLMNQMALHMRRT